MAKLQLNQPTLFLLYGFPGAGKTYFSRQLCEELQAAHVQADRIRYELFESPRYDRQENEIVTHIMEYMCEEFLSSGISVIFDVSTSRFAQRRELRELARKVKANVVLVWFQLDTDSAFSRANNRDHRKTDDKYAMKIDRTSFENIISRMQNPTINEDYMVISGKRTFHTQRSAVIKKLYDQGLLLSEQATSGIAKPGMVNLVPNNLYLAGRVDPSRRNISIR